MSQAAKKLFPPFKMGLKNANHTCHTESAQTKIVYQRIFGLRLHRNEHQRVNVNNVNVERQGFYCFKIA